MSKRHLFMVGSIILLIALLLGLSACSPRESLVLSDTDYSDMSHWLSFGGEGKKNVDILMIYPTVTFSMEEDDRPYVRLDSPLMLEEAEGWLAKNMGLAADSANIYAPLYRQLNGAELASLNSEAFASYTNATPREDIFAALDYYLTNVNKGERPFILLGHSQGAQLVIELSTTFLGNEKYNQHNKNLIAAYAIGCSVTQSQIDANPDLSFSQSREDSGVILSWNTTAPSEVESGIYKTFGTWKQGALISNPLSWTTTETPAEGDGPANAIVDNEHNVLLTTTIDESAYTSTIPNISKYHRYDTEFYYDSVKQNIADRIAAFGK